MSGAREDVGVVFTPAPLADRLAASLEPGQSVLDPACGEGALLLAAFRRAREAGFPPGRALERLYGIERDPGRAQRARQALARAAGRDPEELADRIRCADALTVEWPAGTGVLANPPWGALSGRQAARLGSGPRGGRAESSTTGRDERPGGWPSLQGPFLERIAGHVAAERTAAAVLLPAAVVELPSYGPLRAAVTSLARIEGTLEELGERAFPGVLAPAVLVRLAPHGSGADAGAAAGAGQDPSSRAWSGPASEDAGLVEALAGHPRLPAKACADPGVHTGNSAGLLVRRLGPHEAAEPAPPGWAPVREGRTLRPFDLGPARALLRTDLEPTAERRFRLRARAHYASFPVLLRQTADRPIAALHTAPTYFRNSLLAVRAVEGLDPAFLVAVLNGPLAGAWHRARFRDARQRTFPQVKVSHLREQPLPLAHRDQNPELHDELARRARALDARSDDFEAERERLGRLVLAAFGLPERLLGPLLPRTEGEGERVQP